MSATAAEGTFSIRTSFSFAESVDQNFAKVVLVTYANIHSVESGNLTPWKAEMLWHSRGYFEPLQPDAGSDRSPPDEIPCWTSEGAAGEATLEEIERSWKDSAKVSGGASAVEIAAHFALY